MNLDGLIIRGIISSMNMTESPSAVWFIRYIKVATSIKYCLVPNLSWGGITC